LRQASKNHKNMQGLTLTELLVAMTIGAVVLVLLAQAVSSMSRWSITLNQTHAATEKTQGLFRFFRERLLRTELLTLAGEDGQQVLFEGTQMQVRLVVAEYAYPARPGLYEQLLWIEQTQEGAWQILFARRALSRLDEFGQQPMEEPVLIYTGLLQPKFSYLGEENWHTEWADPAVMPKQIALSLPDGPSVQVMLPAIMTQETNPSETDLEAPSNEA